MPRGKKFDAAEKHFLKQKEVLDRTIKGLRQELQAMTEDRNRFARRYESEKQAREELQKRYDAIKETEGLSESDVRALVKKADSINAIAFAARPGVLL